MIIIKSPAEIERMRVPARIVGKTLEELVEFAEEGMTTRELDRFAESVIRKSGGKPAFKGYRGFPSALCISINEEVVHGIPSGRKITPGDLISVDVGVFFDGYYGDAAISFGLGDVGRVADDLMSVTRDALSAGIEFAKAGNNVSDISHAVQKKVEERGYSVVRDFVGHGIGTSLHEDPQIPNFGTPGQGPVLREGMVLAIEPMVNVGTYKVNLLSDNWTVVTADGRLSAHFEHSVLVTKGTPEILTLNN